MNIIDYLLVFALLTAALYGLYSVLLRWLHTPLPVTGKSVSANGRLRKTRALSAGATRPTAASPMLFSR